jgi:protein-S-isoprenylcysteine O-methyltransferase Ste14
MTAEKKFTLDRILPFLAVLALPLSLFPVAGDWGWWQGWTFLGTNVLFSALSRGLVAKKHPGLLRERASFIGNQGTKAWDKKLVPAVVLLPLLIMVVAALNRRLGWLPPVPLWLQLLGLAGMLLSMAASTWAMLVNRFFSSVVRIQTERGHTVVSDGPYRVVRHPGYAGSILGEICIPFLLGSYWALIPALLVIAAVILRTALEDRTLQAELPGYREYAGRVRYRLFPGLW